VKNAVANKIRLERLRLNLSQQNMADELGITVAAYSNLERGVSEISVSRLYIIAELLKRSPQWFLEESENTNSVSDSATGNNYEHTDPLSEQLYRLIQEMQELKNRMAILEAKTERK
jgi:transcriptional regulator with XRE-family HTH domain